MADDEKQPDEEKKKEKAAGSKAPKKLIGSIFGLIILGTLAAMLAIPSNDGRIIFKGPFAGNLIEGKLSANLKDEGGKRYLQIIIPNFEYFAYDETYIAKRKEDPLFKTLIKQQVNRIGSGKFVKDVHEGPPREAYFEELRLAIDRIVFPVHLGDTNQPGERDGDSGLRLGLSSPKAEFRGRYHDHILKVDNFNHTLEFDGGEPVTFEGEEDDLRVVGPNGRSIYVDVTGFNPKFQGEVKVGVMGKIRLLIETELILQ